MTPTKVKDTLSTIAKKNNLDEEVLKKINTFFWSKMRETLTSTTQTSVNVLGLGVFRRKYAKVQTGIVKIDALLASNKLNDEVKENLLIQKEHLINCSKQIDVTKRNKELKKFKRYEYNKNMEEQKSNN